MVTDRLAFGRGAIAAGSLCVAAATYAWLAGGRDLGPLLTVFTVVCALAIAVGEVFQTTLNERPSAPISTAAGLALALSPVHDPHGRSLSAAMVILVVAVAMAVAAIVRALAGRRVSGAEQAARILGMGAVAVICRQVPFEGRSVIEWSEATQHRWLVALVLVVVSAIGVLVDLGLRGVLRSRSLHVPLRVALRDDVSALGVLGGAMVATGALIAVAWPAVGVIAVPLFLLPIALAQIGMRRHEAVRATYVEMITALARLTDLTGNTRPGHSRLVARLAVDVGRDLGLSEAEVTELEYAALLHDLGQVALRSPIPGGATLLAAPGDQRRIAEDGAAIVRRTGVLDTVAGILEHQTTPFRQVRELGETVPIESRIVKVVNAYVDLMSDRMPSDDDAALERIHLGLGYEYDPSVVDSLTTVLRRRRTGGAHRA